MSGGKNRPSARSAGERIVVTFPLVLISLTLGGVSGNPASVTQILSLEKVMAVGKSNPATNMVQVDSRDGQKAFRCSDPTICDGMCCSSRVPCIVWPTSVLADNESKAPRERTRKVPNIDLFILPSFFGSFQATEQRSSGSKRLQGECSSKIESLHISDQSNGKSLPVRQ